MKLLDKDELRAVLGQEMSHIRNRDMLVITLLSGIPLVMYWIVWSLMLGGAFGGRRQGDGGYVALIGLGAFYSNARLKGSEELKRVEGVKAFFLNDPSRAWSEIRELSQVDRDMSGTIDYDELMELRQKKVRLRTSDKMMEFFSSHPNALKRVKHLSTLVV